jgi:hypothetical protein
MLGISTLGQLMPSISTLGQLVIVSGFSCCDRIDGRIRISEYLLDNYWLPPWSTSACCRIERVREIFCRVLFAVYPSQSRKLE